MACSGNQITGVRTGSSPLRSLGALNGLSGCSLEYKREAGSTERLKLIFVTRSDYWLRCLLNFARFWPDRGALRPLVARRRN